MRWPILLLSLVNCTVLATDEDLHQCFKGNDGAVRVMTTTMLEDFKLDRSVLAMEKTVANIITVMPIDNKLAMMYGEMEHQLDGLNSDMVTTAEAYAHGFMQDNAKNVIVKYTYEDHQGRQNILLTSSFVSNSDCRVRFNGYIVVQREF